jgi:O-antigen/teichoic acid export membrane protein
LVARAIGVENFGIAATFSITVSIFDLIGNLSVDRLLIQAKDGNEEDFQAAAHLVQGIRGVLSCILMFACAWPVAHLFGIPQAAWAFKWLALLPLFRGFTHLDIQRMQRGLRYGRAVGLDIVQQVLPTLIAWPFAVWIGDYSAMLWLVLLQAFIAMVGSYKAAERRYRWFWHAAYAKRFASFGWPLMANSILLFGIYQGDRFLIGTAGRTLGAHRYTLKDLGIYSVATSLTLTPMIAMATVCTSLMLPLFSGLQTEPEKLRHRYDVSGQLVGLLSGLFAIPLILDGGTIVTAIYGPAYSQAGGFIGWLAAAQAVRMARFTPSMGAMAFGDTTNTMYSNLVRFMALFGTLGVIFVGGSLMWIAVFGFFGELLGLAVCLWKLERDHAIPMALGTRSVAALLVTMAVTGLLAAQIVNSGLILRLALIPILLALFVGGMMLVFPAMRSVVNMRDLGFLGIRPEAGQGDAP